MAVLWKVCASEHGKVVTVEDRLTLPEARALRDKVHRPDHKVWVTTSRVEV